MSVLADLKREIEEAEGARELPETAYVVMKIAAAVDELDSKLPRDLIFRAAVQAVYGDLGL